MLIKRIASSIILITILTVALFVDWMLGLLTAFFIVMGLYEFFTMLERKNIRIYKYFGICMGLFIPFSIMFRFEPTRSWELLFIIVVLVSLILMQFTRRQNSGATVGISTTIFGILYISWFLSFLIKIRYLHGGFGYLLTVLSIAKLGDIGAYLIGVRFGRFPLMPRISPKKTIEGSIGGLVFSMLAALACRPFLHVNFLYLLFIGFFFGALAQLGDLSESLIKRDCQVKDSGNIFPGMGGFLDLVDSLIFTAPVFYFYLNAVLK